MKVLLDENVPHDLRPLLTPEHEVFTIAYLGWRSIENGELLRKARENAFDALITTDSKMQYEHNLEKLPISVVVLHAPSNAIEHLRPLVKSLLQTLATLTLCTLRNVRE